MHLFLDPSQSLWILFFLESLRGGKDCLTRRPEILLSPGSVSGHGKLNHDLGLCPVMGELSPLSYFIQFSSVQLLSRVRLFATPWTAARQASLFITNSWSLIKLMSIESAMPPNHLILCHPLLLPHSVFPIIRVFQMCQLLASGGRSIGVSAAILVLPMNTQDWSPLGWTVWISLQSKGLSRGFSNTTVQKHQFFSAELSL